LDGEIGVEEVSGLEIIRTDGLSGGIRDEGFGEGVVVSVARFVKIQGIVARNGEDLEEIGKAVDEVVEEGGSVQLERQFSHEAIDIIGAVSQGVDGPQRYGVAADVLERSGLKHGGIEDTLVLIDLNINVGLCRIEIKEGGSEIDLGDTESADVGIDTRKHEATIGGLGENTLISVQTLKHDDGGNICPVHLDRFAGCHGARI
jgi:hypothetical protein